MQVYTTKVVDVPKGATGVGIIRLGFQGPVPFSFRPGQYVLVHAHVERGRELKPYSIASPPSEKRFIELCIKDVPEGHVSHYMVNLKKGQEVEVSGPGGIFTLQEEIGNDLVFAATGTGISAIKPMIETIFEKGTGHRVFLFYGARQAEELAYRGLFESLAKKHKNFHFIPVISRDPQFPGERGHVQDAIPRYVHGPRGKDIYICGVLRMVEETISWAEQYGFEKRKIHFEKYV